MASAFTDHFTCLEDQLSNFDLQHNHLKNLWNIDARALSQNVLYGFSWDWSYAFLASFPGNLSARYHPSLSTPIIGPLIRCMKGIYYLLFIISTQCIENLFLWLKLHLSAIIFLGFHFTLICLPCYSKRKESEMKQKFVNFSSQNFW